MNIGTWVRRPLGNITKWHIVESVIDGDAITRCGRRMVPDNQNGELEVRDTMPLTRAIGQPQLCRQCDPEPANVLRMLEAEDDPTVGTVTYTITSNDPLQTITGPRVEWTANSVDVSGGLAVDDDPTVGQVDPT